MPDGPRTQYPGISVPQQRALEILHACGKMTKSTAKRHGVQTRTLDSLVAKALATSEHRGSGPGGYTVWQHKPNRVIGDA